jgi:predicted ATPase
MAGARGVGTQGSPPPAPRRRDGGQPLAERRLELTPLIGREEDLAQITDLTERARLVTITGVGGAGKTRLALELARRLTSRFPDGVVVVPLSSAFDAETLVAQVATQLEVQDAVGTTQRDAVLDQLADRRMLLVLDNCEHLRLEVAELALDVLAAGPEMRVLATSQAPLGVTAEVARRLPSLSVESSMELFSERSTALDPHFTSDPGSSAEVRRICQRLDGIPLAIELAAARTRVLSPRQIADRLDSRFELLTGGDPLGPSRQQTLRTAVDWSYNLLGEPARTVWRRLSVFPASFNLDAAEAVAAIPGVLDALTELVDHSVVRVERVVEENRYTMLETVRAYGLERLAADADEEAARQRHAAHYRALALLAEQEWRGAEQRVWLDRLEVEFDNFRAALRFFTDRGEGADALRIIARLWMFWLVRGHRPEARHWLKLGLELEQAPSEARVLGLRELGRMSFSMGESETAITVLKEGLETAELLGDRRAKAYARSALGLAYYFHGDFQDARRMHEAGLAMHRENGDTVLVSIAALELARVLLAIGDVETAEPLHLESLALHRARGDVWQQMWAHVNAGTLAELKGEPRSASAQVREALAMSRSLRDQWGTSECLNRLAWYAADLGQPALSATLLGAAAAGMRVEGARQQGAWRARQAECERKVREALGSGFDSAFAAGLAVGPDIDVDAPDTPASAARRVSPPEDVSAVPATLPTTPDQENVYLREGDFWSLAYAGKLVRLKDSKGLRDIAQLMANQGRELASVDLLVSPTAVATPSTGRPLSEPGFDLEGDLGTALDPQARQQYRERLQEVDAEIADAEGANDPERLALARRERDFLLQELGAAMGLGGRPRTMLDPAERARKAVTARIREAIDRVEAAHPALGKHLRRSIRTGTFCVYDPPGPTAWRL